MKKRLLFLENDELEIYSIMFPENMHYIKEHIGLVFLTKE